MLGTLLVGGFAPALLRDPGGWLAALHWQARAGGMASEMRPFGIATGTAPLIATLHLAGWLLVCVGALHWPRRVRGGEIAPLIAVLVAGAALPAGFAQRAPLLLLLLWAAGEAGRGGRIAWRRWPRPIWAGLLLLLAVLPPLGTQLVAAVAHRTEAPPEAAAIAELEGRLPEGSLIAYDLGITAPRESHLLWVPISFHSVAPEIHRGAYWSGWYRGFAAYLVSERLVRRFLSQAERLPEVIDFYATLGQAGARQRVYGAKPGQRVRVIEQTPAPDGMPAPGWRERVAAGAKKQGDVYVRCWFNQVTTPRQATAMPPIVVVRRAGGWSAGLRPALGRAASRRVSASTSTALQAPGRLAGPPRASLPPAPPALP